MEEEKGELPIRPFVDIVSIEDLDEEGETCVAAPAERFVDPKNPNVNDSRRLFQERILHFEWDEKIPYIEQPNLLEHHGPVPLKYPDHFYQVEGGVVLIYFETDRNIACIAEIKNVCEEENTFTFRPYGWQGKRKKTWFESGKDLLAKQSDV